MSTTTRKECINTINEFLKSPNFQNSRKLLDYYLEDKDEQTIVTVNQLINQNPDMIRLAIPNILKELGIRYSLNELTKNNNLISVF